MTKKVRVEEADAANFKMIVQVWDKGLDGKPDTMAEEVEYYGPADLRDFYITSSRYLIVKEKEPV